jgi:hypothetical protein
MIRPRQRAAEPDAQRALGALLQNQARMTQQPDRRDVHAREHAA